MTTVEAEAAARLLQQLADRQETAEREAAFNARLNQLYRELNELQANPAQNNAQIRAITQKLNELGEDIAVPRAQPERSQPGYGGPGPDLTTSHQPGGGQ